MSPVSRGIDRIAVTFDEPTLVADAGLIVPATLMVRLGLEALVNAMVNLGGRVGGSRPGRKVLTLVAAIMAGTSHIDHADRLRAGATGRVLPFGVMAPSTLGTFLRAFTFGHIRQLDAVIAESIRRAWSMGAGPGAPGRGPRSTHAAGRCGVLLLCPHRHLGAPRGGVFDHGEHQRPGEGLHRAIDESAWLSIAYPEGGMAQVAETTYVTGTRGRRREQRLVVRRSRLADARQAALWPDWRHHAFVTNVELDTVSADAFHRAHANVELAIRDLKEGAGLEHSPSEHFFANAAWLACAVLAHNLIRWSARLGDVHPGDQLTVARQRAHPGPRPSGSPGQSQRHHRLAPPGAMALGPQFHQGARSDPGPAPSHLSVTQRGPAQPQTLSMCADNREGHEQKLFHVYTAVRPDYSPFKERDITSDFAMAENRWIEA